MVDDEDDALLMSREGEGEEILDIPFQGSALSTSLENFDENDFFEYGEDNATMMPT